MSKINPAGPFSQLFRQSRVAQMPHRLDKFGGDRAKAFPTHQVIETTPSSLSRRDFGLKLRLPRRVKARHIVVDNLDNRYGLPDFEWLNGFYWQKLRFKQLGVAVKQKGSDESPLFPSTTKKAASTISQALHLKRQSFLSDDFQHNVKPQLQSLRKPFLQWLVKTHPERLNNGDLTNEIVEFLEQRKTPASASKVPVSTKLSGTAGLSYTLKGRLHQTPNGAESSNVLPGRFLQSRVTGNKFGVGGFVGSSALSFGQVNYVKRLQSLNKVVPGTDKFSREFKIPVVVNSVTVDPEEGSLKLQIDPVRSKKRYSGRNSLMSVKRNVSPRAGMTGNDKETSVLNSLLGLLENVDKK